MRMRPLTMTTRKRKLKMKRRRRKQHPRRRLRKRKLRELSKMRHSNAKIVETNLCSLPANRSSISRRLDMKLKAFKT